MLRKIIKSDNTEIAKRLNVCSTYRDVDSDLKNDIKKSCMQEQRGLCAYCYRKISLSQSNIEHVVPRNKNSKLQLEYSNMVASCVSKNTCNQRRGNKDLPSTPFDDSWTGVELNYSGEFSYQNSNVEESFNILNVGNENGDLVADRKKFIEGQLNTLSCYQEYLKDTEGDTLRDALETLYIDKKDGSYLKYGPFVEDLLKNRFYQSNS